MFWHGRFSSNIGREVQYVTPMVKINSLVVYSSVNFEVKVWVIIGYEWFNQGFSLEDKWQWWLNYCSPLCGFVCTLMIFPSTTLSLPASHQHEPYCLNYFIYLFGKPQNIFCLPFCFFAYVSKVWMLQYFNWKTFVKFFCKFSFLITIILSCNPVP